MKHNPEHVRTIISSSSAPGTSVAMMEMVGGTKEIREERKEMMRRKKIRWNKKLKNTQITVVMPVAGCLLPPPRVCASNAHFFSYFFSLFLFYVLLCVCVFVRSRKPCRLIMSIYRMHDARSTAYCAGRKELNGCDDKQERRTIYN